MFFALYEFRPSPTPNTCVQVFFSWSSWRRLPGTTAKKAISYSDALSIISAFAQELPSVEGRDLEFWIHALVCVFSGSV